MIVGEVRTFAMDALPAGWLPCDGAAVSRATHAALFTAIGTAWGAGDGMTTFNVPDLRGRSPMGSGTGTLLTPRTLAQTLGEEQHQLDVAELAAHSHPVTDVGHTHLSADGFEFVTNNPAIGGPAGLDTTTSGNFPDNTVASAMAGVEIDNAGGDTAHNTIHPVAVVRFAIFSG